LKIYGIARAALALAPRVALSFVSESIAFLKHTTAPGYPQIAVRPSQPQGMASNCIDGQRDIGFKNRCSKKQKWT
jgi:hypothetical protein